MGAHAGPVRRQAKHDRIRGWNNCWRAGHIAVCVYRFTVVLPLAPFGSSGKQQIFLIAIMDDQAMQGSANGFLLGLQVAERTNGLSIGSTLSNQDRFLDLILGLAEGSLSFDCNSELLQYLPGSADPQTKQASTRAAMQKTAVEVIEWYRRQCMW